MKINFYPQITQILNKVTDKSGDKQGGAGQNAYERQQKKDQKQEEQVVNDQTVQEALSAFAADSVNQNSGISAIVEGNGPGLKIILKDAGGGVLRAVSGEEFLKLRESVNQGKRSGRILDQKA